MLTTVLIIGCVLGYVIAAVKLTLWSAEGTTGPIIFGDAAFGVILSMFWPVFFAVVLVLLLSRIAARIETRITAFDITDPDKLKDYRR